MNELHLRKMWAMGAASDHGWSVTTMPEAEASEGGTRFACGWHEQEFQAWKKGYLVGLENAAHVYASTKGWASIKALAAANDGFAAAIRNVIAKAKGEQKSKWPDMNVGYLRGADLSTSNLSGVDVSGMWPNNKDKGE